jgi:hypothetical protein
MEDGRDLVLELDLPFLACSAGLEISVVEINLTNIRSVRSCVFRARSSPGKVALTLVVFHRNVDHKIVVGLIGSATDTVDLVALRGTGFDTLWISLDFQELFPEMLRWLQKILFQKVDFVMWETGQEIVVI